MKKKNYRYLGRYGLSRAGYEAMVAAQGGVCGLGGCALGRGVVDHDHVSGRVRGVLCDSCNTALGRFGDDPGRLLAGVRYLVRAGTYGSLREDEMSGFLVGPGSAGVSPVVGGGGGRDLSSLLAPLSDRERVLVTALAFSLRELKAQAGECDQAGEGECEGCEEIARVARPLMAAFWDATGVAFGDVEF